MASLKPIDKHELGDQLEPLEYVVTPELNQQYLYAENAFHPRYVKESEFGPPLVHPSLLLNMSSAGRSASHAVSPGLGVLHAGEETTFINPAVVGDTLRVTWRMIDRFEKRGRLYHTREALVVNGKGVEILRRTVRTTFTSK